MTGLQIDPEFHALISPLSKGEYDELQASLQLDGCRDALVCWNGLILDGHNRFEICNRLNLPFQILSKNLSDRQTAKEWIITNQLGRRNITLFQRTRLVLKRDGIVKARAKERMLAGKSDPEHFGAQGSGRTNKILARQAGTSHKTVWQVRVIENEASEEVKKELMEGRTTINREYRKLRGKSVSEKIKPSTKERIAKIRELASLAFKADQIAAKIGCSESNVRQLAKKGNIELPDAVLGKIRRIDVNRVIAGTVTEAESLISGLELIASRLDGIDVSRIDGWIDSLTKTINALRGLITQIKRRKQCPAKQQ